MTDRPTRECDACGEPVFFHSGVASGGIYFDEMFGVRHRLVPYASSV